MASVAIATGASSSSSSTSSLTTMDEARTNSPSHTTLNNTDTNTNAASGGGESNEPQKQPCQPQHEKQTTELRHDNTQNHLHRPEEQNLLPPDLRRILKQVAKTGRCHWMLWDQETDVSSRTRSAWTAASASASLTSRPGFSTRRSFQGPLRKNNRNGLHNSTSTKRRFGDISRNNPLAIATAAGAKKRPLFVIRTGSNSGGMNSATPGSVGSGRTSGSEAEHDESTQYECDSEGTSTTTNSETSLERLRKTQQVANANALHAQSNRQTAASKMAISSTPPGSHYKTLQDAFRIALGIVLDHFYRQHGGYKLVPAEKRRIDIMLASGKEEYRGLSPDAVFQQRKQRLLNMLRPEPKRQKTDSGCPFTIQRIAEVLVNPERYYTQTHKLCNCLEKLLLVRSPTEAFGGSTGGNTAQSRIEEQEMAALAEEKGRQDLEMRHRRGRRRASSAEGDDSMVVDAGNEWGTKPPVLPNGKDDDQNRKDGEQKKEDGYVNNPQRTSPKVGGNGGSGESSRELLEATARASLRSKFDHVGIDPHSSQDRDIRGITEDRGMTNSPPPPNLAMSAAPSNIAMQNHSGVAGFARHHLADQNGDHRLAHVPSPIVFSPGNDSQMNSTTNMHMLQLHHAVALAGVSLGRGGSSHLDLMAIDGGSGRSHNNLENADGRSSTSNSDVDSESDDISLDDSASDRSDGSDSGSLTHHEPFSAARAMALNRIQQQQRLQHRALTSLNLHQSDGGFRPPADSEYQSGDSIDSTRAEDSGGSDSSSSDVAD
eukprot:scaffold7738_cov133-Cylindrotheca_fusiformis.AAC.29